MVDIVNGYPDPTYGLTKRQSTYFLWTLKKFGTNEEFTEEKLKDAFWFFSQTKIKVTEENKDKYPNDDVGDYW